MPGRTITIGQPIFGTFNIRILFVVFSLDKPHEVLEYNMYFLSKKTVLQGIKKSFEDIHLDVNIYSVSPASL